MIYFIFPFDWGLFGGNQALTVGPVLWLSCLHCSSGDMLTLRRAETESYVALRVSTVFRTICRICSLSWPDAGKDRSAVANEVGYKQGGQATGRNQSGVEWYIQEYWRKKIPHNLNHSLQNQTFEGFVRHCLFCGLMVNGYSRCKCPWSEKYAQKNSHAGKRHQKEEEILIYSLAVLPNDQNATHFWLLNQP